MDEWTASITVPCLTPLAVRALTGLDWKRATTPLEIPRRQGVYVWAKSETSAVIYHGKADARKDGLFGRAGNEMKWRDKFQSNRDASVASGGDPLDWSLTSWVPMVQGAVRHQADCWYAVTEPAQWEDWAYEDVPPADPREWEAFISECSRLIAGHRGLLGGGAWESRPDSVGGRMARVAWARIKDLGIAPAWPEPSQTAGDPAPGSTSVME